MNSWSKNRLVNAVAALGYPDIVATAMWARIKDAGFMVEGKGRGENLTKFCIYKPGAQENIN